MQDCFSRLFGSSQTKTNNYDFIDNDSRQGDDFDSFQLSLQEIRKLQKGQIIDFRDSNGFYRSAKIEKVKKYHRNFEIFQRLQLRFIGDSNQYHDQTIKVEINYECEGSIFKKGSTTGDSSNPNARLSNLKIGDRVKVFIPATTYHWKTATVVNKHQRQVQVEYSGQKYWIHLDDKEEIKSAISDKSASASNHNDINMGGCSDDEKMLHLGENKTNKHEQYNSNNSNYNHNYDHQQRNFNNYNFNHDNYNHSYNDSSTNPQNKSRHSNHDYDNGCNNFSNKIIQEKQIQEQIMINRDQQIQKEKVVRTQLLIDATNDQINFLNQYFTSLIDLLVCQKEISNDKNNFNTNNKNELKLSNIKSYLSTFNENAACGLQLFHMQCRALYKKQKKEGFDFNIAFKNSENIIDKFENELKFRLVDELKCDNNELNFILTRIEPFTNYMKSVLLGNKPPLLPTSADYEFNQEVATDTISKVMFQMNHETPKRIANIENNYEKIQKQHENNLKLCKNQNNNNTNVKEIKVESLFQDVQGPLEQPKTGKEQREMFNKEMERERVAPPDLLQ